MEFIGRKFESFDKRKKDQEAIRDTYKENSPENIQEIKDSIEEEVREMKKENQENITSGDYLAALKGFLLRKIYVGGIKYIISSAPRVQKIYKNWADRYGKELAREIESKEKKINDSEQNLSSYISQKYGYDMKNFDINHLPQDLESDSKLKEFVVNLVEAKKEMAIFLEKYGQVSIENEGKKATQESANFLAEISMSVDPGLKINDLTDAEREYINRTGEIELKGNYLKLLNNGSETVDENSSEDAKRYAEDIKSAKSELDSFIKSNWGVREKAEYKMHVRKSNN